MEVKQYTKVLVWDWNKCPEYRGFLIMEYTKYDTKYVTEIAGFPYMEVSLYIISNLHLYQAH